MVGENCDSMRIVAFAADDTLVLFWAEQRTNGLVQQRRAINGL